MNEYGIKFLLSQCIVKEENGYFTRFDIIINYLAIENYYGKNDFGWKFHDQYEKTSGLNDPVESKARFIELIKSFEKNGKLTSQHPLKLSDINYRIHIRDGGHRLACAIYFGFDRVFGHIRNPRKLANRKTSKMFKRMCDVGSHKIINRGFSQEEIEIIRSKKNEILEKFGLLTGQTKPIKQTNDISSSCLLAFCLNMNEWADLFLVI